MDPTVVTPQSFNFFVLFLHADGVVKLVMLGLAAASLWSWTVILDKGEGTIVDFDRFDAAQFEERMVAHPKVLLRFGGKP